MLTLTVERVIAAPPEQVFDWFADSENFAASRAVVRHKLVEPAVDLPYGVGSVRTVTWLFGSYTERITVRDAPKKIGWLAEKGIPGVRHLGAELTFTPVPEGTRVVLTSAVEVTIPFAVELLTRRLGLPMLAAGYRDVLRTADIALTSPRKTPRLGRPNWLTKPRNYIFDQLLILIRTIHHSILKASGGRVGSTLFGMPVIEVHVTGRATGARRTVLLWDPIMDGERVILVASKEGDDRNPEWYRNLRANPTVEVTMNGVTESWVARTANANEKAELWPKIVKAYHGFAVCQTRTAREIPVVICERPTNSVT
ncbi:deazaflavin-dependent oxidoreductase (nitroreductase family) [Nocardia pseudobrasiliensis]|uniref:Deazaflavin-dependent oxidoreductase (Nitroreductase family) n=1 Tax=Nocardia pseudobrasiliensis TaxID=45979 RepID=A0A370I0R9_9NOCA|nr:deazaflavin-dependent oxidoreductase (nitroreductase family) [Nocardia pseudobrasiliensis]